MLISNTMRFGTDEIAFAKQALLVSKIALDTAEQTSIEGFSVTGIQPTGTNRRFMFKVDDKNWVIGSGGAPVEFTSSITAENVLKLGNTADEVNAASDLSAWVGKKIYPIIALEAPIDANVMPTAKIAVIVKSNTEIFERTVDSAEINLRDEGGGSTPQIIDVKDDTTSTGNGNVEVLIRVKKDDTWSAFTSLAAAEGADADAVQFRVHYQVTKVNNVDSAKVNKITMRYTTGAAKVSGDVAELYSTVQNYGADLSTAILSIRHKPLADSIIKAYVNFLSPTKRRTLIDIGTASGSSEQFILGVDGVRDTGIDQSSIRLFADGQPLLNFSYNTEVSEVTVNATAGKTITASYEYDHEPEVWHEMSCEVNQQPYDDGFVQSRYIYSLGDDERGLQVANIRINMFRTSGHVDEEILGVGTGGVQMFVLKHAAKEDTINCNAEWAYNADSQIITCVAPVGTKIVAAYDWLGEQHVLYSWTAGFTAAL